MDVYKIGVKIALANGMSSVLAIISRDLLGVHTKVRDIENSFGRWAAAAGGAAAVVTGAAILGGMGKLVNAGAEVNHQFELMKLQGMSVAEAHEASARAMAVSGQVLTSTYADNLKHIRELRYAFGDTPDALKYLGAVTKANAVINAFEGPGGNHDRVWDIVKSLEMKGLTSSPEKFESFLEQMTKGEIASGGKVTASQYFSAFKYGRTAMLGWDENFIGAYLPRLIQSWSSSHGGGGASGGPGNALMSGFQTVVGGHMTKAAGMVWEKLGLATMEKIPGSSQVLTRVKQPLVDSYIKSPYEFAQMIAPAIINAAGGKNPEKMTELTGQLFQNRTIGAAMVEMILQGRAVLGDLSPFEKDAKLQREAFDQRMSYDELIKNDYETIMKAFHAQWKSLQQVVGEPLTRPDGEMNKVLASITHLMNEVSGFAGAHPEALKIAVDVLASLAGGLVVAGVVALGAAILPLVGVAGGIAAAAAALGMLAALNWDKIKGTPWFYQSQPGLGNEGSRSLPNDSPGGAAFDRPSGPYRRRSSYIPPGGAAPIQLSTVLNLDGQRIAEVVTRHQVRDGAGPAQGAPYHDPTYSTNPLDLVLV